MTTDLAIPDARLTAARTYAGTGSLERAAEASGIPLPSLQILAVHDSNFRTLVESESMSYAIATLVGLTAAAPIAVDILKHEMVLDEPDAKRIRVAKTVLDLFFRSHEMLSLNRRVQELENSARGIVDAEVL